MVAKWSAGITAVLANNGIIDSNESEIYAYGFELMISTVLNALVIAIIAILTNTFLFSFAFVVCFGMIRIYAGGYHAGSHLRCFGLFCIMYAIILIAESTVPVQWTLFVGAGAVIPAVFVIWKLAPIEDENRPLKERERAEFIRKVRIVVVWQAVVIMVLHLLMNALAVRWLGTLATGMSFGVLAAAISVAAGYIKNVGKEERVC